MCVPGWRRREPDRGRAPDFFRGTDATRLPYARRDRRFQFPHLAAYSRRSAMRRGDRRNSQHAGSAAHPTLASPTALCVRALSIATSVAKGGRIYLPTQLTSAETPVGAVLIALARTRSSPRSRTSS
jgi:hypothetical protein